MPVKPDKLAFVSTVKLADETVMVPLPLKVPLRTKLGPTVGLAPMGKEQLLLIPFWPVLLKTIALKITLLQVSVPPAESKVMVPLL